MIKSNYAPARYRTVQPFGIVPLWSSRGQADLGVFDDGGLDRCETDVDGKLRCVQIAWPGWWFANERPKFRPFWWHGSVVEDKRDATGTLYRRNRYLDAQTGRFTQEDPIGLAGGLNAYGFADGDPISYSDPYGLCSVPTALGGVAFGYAVSKLAGTSYTRRDAAVDAALGCVGAIGVRALGRANSVRRARLAAAADDALEAAGRALSARAASAGRQTFQQQGDRILTMNRHAATGSRGSRAAHDFASAGLDVNDVANAVARDIGDLSALSQGVARGTVQVGQTTIAYSRNTMTTGETVVNFWIR